MAVELLHTMRWRGKVEPFQHLAGMNIADVLEVGVLFGVGGVAHLSCDVLA